MLKKILIAVNLAVALAVAAPSFAGISVHFGGDKHWQDARWREKHNEEWKYWKKKHHKEWREWGYHHPHKYKKWCYYHPEDCY
jgi:hypothetical protein